VAGRNLKVESRKQGPDGEDTGGSATAYDGNGNRLSVTRVNGAAAYCGYDDVGKLVSAVGYEPGGNTQRGNENFGYFYDGAENLLSANSQWFVNA